jgi:capsular polysaccharide biosynthesis protein
MDPDQARSIGSAYSGPRDVYVALRRRWWLVLGLPILVLGLSLLLYDAPAVVYQARLSFAVDVPAAALVPGSDEGTAAKIGEALIDDLSRIISGDVFAEAVAAHLANDVQVAPGELASSLSATDRHRIADVTVTRAAQESDGPEELAALQSDLAAIAEAVVTELETNGTNWFARLGDEEVRLTVVSRPTVVQLAPPLRVRLDIPLRIVLALLIGIGLALVWHYFDERLYDAREAAAAARAPVIGRIPGHRAWTRRSGGR